MATSPRRIGARSTRRREWTHASGRHDWLLPFGYLAFRSGFIPRVFGVLLMAAGTAILLESVTFLVAPALHPVVSEVTALPSAVGEIAAMLWLLLKGARSDPAAAVTPGGESETL